MDKFTEVMVMLLTNAFELYVIYRFMVIFFDNHMINKNKTVIAYIVRYVLTAVAMLAFSYPILNVIIGWGSLLLIAICYKSTISKKIIVPVMIYMCMFFAEAIIAALIGFSGFYLFEKSEFANSFMSILMEILFWIITVILAKFKNVKVNMPVPKLFIVAIIIVPVTSIFLEALIFQQENVNRIVVAISLVFLLASNFIMIYVYDSLSKLFEERTQAEIVRREKNYYHNQSELLQKNYEELRQFRHDIKNRILVIKQMLDKNETERIYEYISHMMEILNNTKVYSQSGNVVVDSIINYKLSKAENLGSEVKANIGIPTQINIEDDDIVIVLGNLLDNAIEAVERVEDNKYIEVNIEYNKDCVFVAVKNSYDNVINIVNGKIKTRKNDKVLHGIGLKSVETTVEKYNGVIHYEHDQNEFVASVILYV